LLKEHWSVLWQSLSEPWRACLDEAWAAYCAGSVPIGAVITDCAGQILSRGRNRIYDREPSGRAIWGTRLAHAEMNALAPLDPREIQLEACVLYTTTEPCPMCTGAIRMCHIGEVRYASRDTMGGSVALLQATPFMQLHPCRVVEPERADLEALIIALHVELALRLATTRTLMLPGAWQAVSPAGVQLGTELFHSRQLQQWCAAGMQTPDLIAALEAML
jgi:tRNA(adenine34) deaminase